VGGGSVGPTLNLDGTPGLEVDGDVGAGLVFAGSGNADNAPIHTVMVGLQASIGVAPSHPRVPVSIQAFAEYLRLGAPAARWGGHVRLAIGLGTWNGGSVPISLIAGPLRFYSQDAIISDSPGDPCLGSVAFGYRQAQGLDLSMRLLLDRAVFKARAGNVPSRLQLGLFYTFQRERFVEFPCLPEK
jgi:hypothetical protein